MQKLLWFLIFILITYITLTALLYMFQEKLIFLPSNELTATPESVGIEYEDVYFPSENGNQIHGWFASSDSSDVTLLYSHGNAGNMADRINTMQTFLKMGYSVLMYDYQGYGKSEGFPSEQHILEDGLAAWHYLTDKRSIDKNYIIPVGRSLGGSVATHIAVTQKTKLLILESTFTSVPDVAAYFYPIFPVKKLARVQLNTLKRLKEYEGALLVAHSKDDRVIPYKMGRALFESFEGNVQWLELKGPHYEGYAVSGSVYSETYRSFIHENLTDSL